VRVNSSALLIWLSATMGCGSNTPATSHAAAPLPTPHHLAWSPQGHRVIVDERLSAPVDGRPIEVLPPLARARVIFAPDGRVALLAPGMLIIDGTRIALPTIQSPPVPNIEVTGFWLDLHRLYVHEWHPIKQASACRLFDRRTGGLRALQQCVTAGRPTRLQGGPGNLVAVHEAGSAGPTLAVRRFAPDGADDGVLRYDLRPDGAVALAFDADGGGVHMVSDCDLSRALPCVGPARLPAPMHVRYDVLERRVRVLKAAPLGAVPGPGGRLAWPIAGGICLDATPTARATCLEMVPLDPHRVDAAP
jgi:hypothetical protein